MISTGNDIVALKAINVARTRQSNFYQKIISVSEKALLDQLSGRIPLEHFVWLLWSVKESAYKYLQRITPDLVFSPTRTIVDHLQLPSTNTVLTLEGCGFAKELVYKGVVTFGDYKVYSRSMISEEFIFSVVSGSNDFENTYWGIQLIGSSEPEDQSKAVRELLSDRLKALFPYDIQIGKSPHGYPTLIKDGIEIAVPVSFAHHDRYVAYSFVLVK
jgi:phosphopantetheinyl transferase (holo-ACP synthase)